MLSTSGCERWLVKTEAVEVKVQQFVPLDETLTAPIAVAPVPAPECMDAGKPVSCTSQLLDYIHDTLFPVIWEHACDKAMIRCTQVMASDKPQSAKQSALMQCVMRAGANECSIPSQRAR